jgi:hypothetical protein
MSDLFVGLVEVGTALGNMVESVTLDGVKVTNCVRANDREGWVECLTGETSVSHWLSERVHGTVHFTMKPDAVQMARNAIKGTSEP